MTEAREVSTWTPFSALMALLANCHRDPRKTREFRPADFHPFMARVKRPADMDEIRRWFGVKQ